jgi:hypothetical protein
MDNQEMKTVAEWAEYYGLVLDFWTTLEEKSTVVTSDEFFKNLKGLTQFA